MPLTTDEVLDLMLAEASEAEGEVKGVLEAYARLLALATGGAESITTAYKRAKNEGKAS